MTSTLFTCSNCLRNKNNGFSYLRRAFKMKKSTKAANPSNLKYCVDTVRKYDYETYLCIRLCPSGVQPVAFAVHSLNVETAQIGDMNFSSDIKTGLIRMQFWRDTVEKVFEGDPPHTPTALALYQCAKKDKISKKHLLKIIDARYRQLNDGSYKSIRHIEDYSEDTKSSLLYLLLEAEGVTDEKVHHVASHVGRSHGLVTLLRSLPYNTSKGQIYLPRESLLKVKVSGEDILRGRKQAEVCDIVKEIAGVAGQHLEEARSCKKFVPNSVKPFFLSTLICDIYLKQLQKVDFNVFHPSLQKKNGLLPLQLLIQKTRRKY